MRERSSTQTLYHLELYLLTKMLQELGDSAWITKNSISLDSPIQDIAAVITKFFKRAVKLKLHPTLCTYSLKVNKNTITCRFSIPNYPTPYTRYSYHKRISVGDELAKIGDIFTTTRNLHRITRVAGYRNYYNYYASTYTGSIACVSSFQYFKDPVESVLDIYVDTSRSLIDAYSKSRICRHMYLCTYVNALVAYVAAVEEFIVAEHKATDDKLKIINPHRLSLDRNKRLTIAEWNDFHYQNTLSKHETTIEHLDALFN